MGVSAPAKSGIYVAAPVQAELVPVTRDPRYVDTCARVNSGNVKVGKAKNLLVRQRNYYKDFDEENIVFIPLLLTHEYGAAETIILRHLRNYRMRSPKGGLMDWLEGISIEDATQGVFDALDRTGIRYTHL